jgi:cell division protein FtsI (penicillin-binding protein 3)
MAAIANGGRLMHPYVVKAVRDQRGRIVKKNHPHMVRRVISESASRKTARILERVVSDEGTAPLAAINGYRVAGKTGTSQKVDPRTRRYSKKNYTAIFAGFVPADDPKLVIAIAIDEPRGRTYGGLVAGPVFKEVGMWTLNYLRINPQIQAANVEEKPQNIIELRKKIFGSILDEEPQAIASGDGLLPDFKGRKMREVLKAAGALGLKVHLEGSGMAVSQAPKPGSPLDRISSVRVLFRPAM